MTVLASPAPSHPPAAGRPFVAVLMCTLNGENFLAAQLDSIAAQTHGHWKIWVSDDGSSDGTRTILERYRETWGESRLSIQPGPQKGFVANFMSLACNPEIQADCYAYADQDDVWEADKLARAVTWIETIPRATPALYMSRTRLIDEDDHDVGLAPLFTSKPPSFANAMVQNIGGGNTMVLNDSARRLITAYCRDVTIVSHDWSAYMLVTGTGGVAFYDPYPSIRYRQHPQNLVGTNAGWLARIWRAGLVWGGRFRRWSEINVQSLGPARDRLTPVNRRIFDQFCAARTGSLPARLWALWRSGVHRQGFVDNIGLYIAAIFNRL